MPTIIVLLSNTLLDLIAISHLIKIVYPPALAFYIAEGFQEKKNSAILTKSLPFPDTCQNDLVDL